MLFCHIGQAKSLREICGGLASSFGKLKHLGVPSAPKRSTLSYANKHRPWELYREIFYKLLDRCRPLATGRKKFRFKNKLFSLDATVMDLCLGLFPWAKFRQTKGAVKLHLLLDHDGYLPVFAHVTEGNVHEVRIARGISFPPGSIVAMDRGYIDYDLFFRWTGSDVYFVSRLKQNARYEVVEPKDVVTGGNILRDEVIRFAGYASIDKYPHTLRRIEVWDDVNGKVLVLITNHFKFAASTIAAIYKERWQIEIFFKTIKQNLKIKTFVGTSKNALLIQIWTALISILVIKYMQFRSSFGWSLSNLVAMLRYNLLAYRDLWQWLDDPYQPPPEPVFAEQLSLRLT